jgi:inner membrane protein
VPRNIFTNSSRLTTVAGMDTVTHALTGAAIGYCGFRQRGGKLALWTTIAAAEFPDADLLMLLGGSETYLRWHRSFTHSALLLPFWATVVAGIFWAFSRRSDFKLLWLAAAAGIASHILLDWLTSYGTMLFWPLSDARLELSWVFILDPYVWAMLGVALWAVLRLRNARAAPVGLAVVTGYFLMCGAAHWFALPRREAGQVRAYAQPLNPFRWTVIHNTGNTMTWSDGRETRTFTQYHDDELLPKAEATEAVKLYRWFAVFPLVERRTENGHTVLRYRDLRFRSRLPDGAVREGLFIVAKVVFDSAGNVLAADLASENR